MKRSQIKVIEVRMGEKNEIDPGQFMNRQGRRSEALRPDRDSRQSNSDAREERRVGNNPYAEEIDQNGRVPEPRRRKSFATPLRWFRLGKGLSLIHISEPTRRTP